MRRFGPRRFSRRALILISTALLALLTIQSAFAQQPSGITEEAHKMHHLFIFVSLLAIAVFALVGGALLVAIIRFRKKDDTLPRQTHGSTPLEMLWVAIPVLLVVIMFSYSVVVLIDVEHSAEPEDMTVHVQGFQFQWKFTYNLNDLGPGSDPNSDASVVVQGSPDEEPELVLPAGEPIEFELFSQDVIHSFYVRDFLYKLDVIPGRDNKFKVTIDEDAIGKVYNGQCAELCGIGHAFMRFTIRGALSRRFRCLDRRTVGVCPGCRATLISMASTTMNRSRGSLRRRIALQGGA